MQYRTSRQSRAAFENITPGRGRRSSAAVVAPSGALYRVARVGGSALGQMVRATSPDEAVEKYRELFSVAGEVALVVSDR